MSVASSKSVQYAALPWRVKNGALEILLITTLTTKSWIVPKGWPMDGLAPCECAAMEALEEAGISGDIATEPLGAFTYLKVRKHGEAVPLRVEVFALQVTRRRRHWSERSRRDAQWCPVEEALVRAGNAGLRRLIAKFAQASAQQEILAHSAREKRKGGRSPALCLTPNNTS